MTKTFCDICGKPAVDKLKSVTMEINWDTPYERSEAMSSGGYSKKIQPKITVSTLFGFKDHKSGFGGPPDLCGECVLSLLDQLCQKSKLNTNLCPNQPPQ